MNKKIIVKSIVTHGDAAEITYMDHGGETHTKTGLLCPEGEHHSGFGDDDFLILHFEYEKDNS